MLEVDIIVLGRGVGASCFLQTFGQFLGPKRPSLLQIAATDLTACSLRTTAMVALSGIERGVGPLGDQLYDSYQLAKEFFTGEGAPYVHLAPRYHLTPSPEEREKVQRRFSQSSGGQWMGCSYGAREEAYVVKAGELLSFWQEKLSSEWGESYQFREGTVLQLEEQEDAVEVLLYGGQRVRAKIVLSALGAYENLLQPKAAAKAVAGSYLSFSGACLERWPRESFVASLSGENALYTYAATGRRLLLGGTTEQGSCQAPALLHLGQMYQKFLDLLPALPWPALSEAQVGTGLRAKRPRRRPFWGAISPRHFIISGLYKNGWSLSFLAAQEMAPQIAKALRES